MAVKIKAVGKTNPKDATQPILYYPRAVQTGVIDLEMLSEQICQSTTLTEADCHAVIYSLVASVSKALEDGKIVRLGHLGTLQVSVKGVGSTTATEVSTRNVKRASIIYRPGNRFKKLLSKLTFTVKK